MASVVPHLLEDGGIQDKGENARLQCYIGAIAIGDMIKSTLGPRGMDKILQPMGGEGAHLRKTNVTNDGATILDNVWIDNPAARILVDVSKRQDQECGDGTTGVVVLASELLREAEKLVDRHVHPQAIIEGYRLALECAKIKLKEQSFQNDAREDLIKIAKTTLSSKILAHDKDHFAELAVDAVLRLKERNNLKLINIIKKRGGRFTESYLYPGLILEKTLPVGAPKKITNCKVMVANTPMDADKVKIFGAKVQAEDFDTVAQIEEAEKAKMKNKVDSIAHHGCNVFINRQLIYNYPEQCFKDHGIVPIEHADFDGMERLAAVLGAEIVSTFDAEQNMRLGECECIEEVLLGEDKVIRFSGCKTSEACTIVLRGASEHILDEAERSLHDALAVVSQTAQHPLVVCGGGSIELAMAQAVEALSRTIGGRKAWAVEAFARALTSIPTIILDNAGCDSADILAKMRSSHNDGLHDTGVDIENGDCGNMKTLGIFESYKGKLSQLNAASQAAEQIIRVDNVIRCPPRKREGQ